MSAPTPAPPSRSEPAPLPAGAHAATGDDGAPARWLDRATVLLTIGFVVIAIGTPLIGRHVFAGTDLVFEQPPWSYLVRAGFVPQNPFIGDTVDGFLPATHEFVSRLRDGDFAQWWPYSSGGAQLGSVPNQALLSPLSLPYLLLPLELAPAYVKLLEMVVGIGGGYLFLRRLELARAAAVLGGLVFVSSGFMIAWTGWPQTRVAAFIPALFWAVERLVQRRRPVDVAWLGAVVAAMVLGGFPAVTWYALVSAAVYGLVRVTVMDHRHPVRGLGVVVTALAGVALGAAVATFQLLPFLQELDSVTTGARTQNPNSHSPIESLVLTVAADAFGGTNLNRQAVEWYGPSHPVEEMSYLGAAAVVLLLIAMVARRRPGMPTGVRGYFVVATVVTVVLIFLGGPLLTTLQHLPVFGDNRMGRIRSMLGFFAAVLAAIGLDALLRPPATVWSGARRRLWRLGTFAFFAVVTVGAAGSAFYARRLAYAGGHPSYFQASLLTAALFGLGAVVAAVLAVRTRGWLHTVGLLALPGLVVAQALMVVLPFWPRVLDSQFYPETPAHEFLQTHLGGERILTADVMATGTEAYYGLRTVGGRGFIATGYAALLRDSCPRCFTSPTYVTGPADFGAFDPDVLDVLGVKYLVADPTAPTPGTEEVLGAGVDRIVLGPEQPVQVALPSGGLRAVGLVGVGETTDAEPYAQLHVELRDAAGSVVVDTRRRLFADEDGGPILAAVPQGPAADAVSATITLEDSTGIAVRGGADGPNIVLMRPIDDGLTIVYSGDSTIYERLTALSRIRWATSEAVEPDAQQAAALLLSGDAPEVVLSAPGPVPSGAPAIVQVTQDGGDSVEAVVDADGEGYLVVADALQDRWSASVDGVPVKLRDADVGVVAIAVPAGRHVVRLQYDVPDHGVGYAVSALAVLMLLALLVLDRRWRRPDG